MSRTTRRSAMQAIKTEPKSPDENGPASKVKVKSEKQTDGVNIKVESPSTAAKRKRSGISVKAENIKQEQKDDEAATPATKKVKANATKSKKPSEKDLQSGADMAAGFLKNRDSQRTESSSKKAERTKNNPYGLSPGESPYPTYPHPTPEECQKVNDILSKAHGKVQAPKTIPTPSLNSSGCGEVPSVLDALVRTRLSAATNNQNSSRAFRGIVEKFGILKEGVGKGSVDWNKVRLANQKDLFEAIKSGGLADVKSRDIKNILQMVYEENQERAGTLSKGKAEALDNVKEEPDEEQMHEVAKARSDVLSLDHLHLLDNDSAFNKLLEYPGIGPKTASCVLLFCMQRPSFAVDTHVFRLTKWLGWVPTDQQAKAMAKARAKEEGSKRVSSGQVTRNSTYAHLDVKIPDELKYPLHYLLIKHGKNCGWCSAKAGAAAKVGTCPLAHLMKGKDIRERSIRALAPRHIQMKLHWYNLPLKCCAGKLARSGQFIDAANKQSLNVELPELDMDFSWQDVPSIPPLLAAFFAILVSFVLVRTLISNNEAAVQYAVTIPSPCLEKQPSTYEIVQTPALQCYCPSNGRLLGRINPYSAEGIDRIIDKAEEAQLVWARTTFAQRRKVLVTAEKLTWTIKHGERALRPDKRGTSFLMMYKKNEVRYEPLGVVAACVSWNYPFHNLLNGIISAIFAGNAIVVKASEQTAWSAQYYISIVRGALSTCGHSPEIVQTVVCWPSVAPHLTSHPSLSHITFIGSRPVAHAVATSAAKALTPVCVELGGKDAAIVLDDVGADIKRIASILMRGVFQSAGQNCIGIERVVATPKSYDTLLQMIAPRVKALKLGSALDDEEAVDVGACISPAGFDRLEALIKDAQDRGAQLLCGGTRYAHPKYPMGHYFSPTLLTGVTPDMPIAQQELFAPVFVLMRATDVDDAIRIANSTPYALGASVFGRSTRDLERVTREVSAGMVAVNDFAAYYMCSLPFGGVRGSGYGRFGGAEGLRALCNAKSVCRDRVGFMSTSIPPRLDYPGETRQAGTKAKAWEFVQGIVELGYGIGPAAKIKGIVKLALNGNYSVEKGRQSDSSFRDLLCEDRDGSSVVRTAQIALLDRRVTTLQRTRAHKRISILGPAQRSSLHIIQVNVSNPGRLLGRVVAAVHLLGERLGPAHGVAGRVAADQLLGHVGVPDVVQVGRGAVEGDGDVVAADLVRLVVQRLRHVAQEVDEELQRLLLVGRGQAAVLHALERGVCNGAHDAAAGAAVTVEVDATGSGGVVVGIDEVEWCGEFAGGCVAEGICPGSDAGEVGGAIVAQDALGPLDSLVRHVKLSKVTDGHVAQGTPCMGGWEKRREGQEDCSCGRHDADTWYGRRIGESGRCLGNGDDHQGLYTIYILDTAAHQWVVKIICQLSEPLQPYSKVEEICVSTAVGRYTCSH
ncbi:hypothetical protein FH972_021214 [Carpinus fangiana]|uniref:HhH-GPD domain-containing protein n=1 Tax=Carpinus fangiana TaxID=176857 RepID=A0A5N6KQV2_9ROSI|nr:hypothetical protein FH972_021214 [Carpinus fangiana]